MKIRTIRGRIVLAIVLVGCIPLLIGLVLAYVSGMRSLRDVIGGNLQAVAIQAADRVTMLVQGEVQGVRLLGSAPLRVRQPVEAANESYPVDREKTQALIAERMQAWEKGGDGVGRLVNAELSRFLLETKVRDGDKVVGLLIADQHGALVAASSEPDHYSFKQELWWTAIHAGGVDQVYISGLIPAHEGSFRTPEETIDIAVPILDDRQHTVIGAVKASYRFDSLFAMINQIRIGQTGHAMLFDAAGNPLVCPILPRQAHRIPAQLMTMIVSSHPGWGIAEDDGHGAMDTVVGFAPVAGLPLPDNSWHIFVRQEPGESYAPIRDQLRNLAAIGLVMLGLLWAMGRYVAARIARPIQILQTGVEAISQGTYDRPLNIRTGDEFEELAAAVHHMADRLKASRGELEALNADLARRVEDKTAEVTEHMKQLQFSERLATLGKVASGIAHEINNPLGIILNRIECMEAEAAQLGVSEEQQRDLVAIRTQADRISRITKSMLALSRGSATVLKPMDVNCVLRACIDASKERALTKGVSIESVLSPSLPPIMGDRDRIETVMLNLINNAIDAAESGVSPGVVTVHSEGGPGKEGGLVAVRISDTGPGIPAEMLGRIFDPFFTTKGEGQGTGLGLFLSYGIVADHRGRLEIDNGRRGAVATVSLPALVSAAESQQEAGWEWEQARY
ncbi:sensor histidine kinase [Nitrospira lenta]|uniref:histidine kinase n=1 Tax=Nitrospira lenta TaxID=1436998 RepID=A0A330LAX0_9BACT|nr:sensor histidine kinase [Nitrospira lenta]SPP66052.1 putative Histidine kinase [Nitrospira lenta]